MAVLEVRLIGPMRVAVAGQVVDPGPEPVRKLIAGLALEAGRVVDADVLAARIWDQPPVANRAALYGFAGRLQRMFAAAGATRNPLRIVEPGGGFRLEADPDRVDALRLHRYYVAANRQGPADPPRTDPYWADVLDGEPELWVGTVLAGLSGGWVARARRQVAEMRIRAALVWAEAMLTAGRAGTVVDPLRALAEQHPLVEPLAAALIQALCEAGKPAEALLQYTAARRLLADELGSTPGLALRRLHRAIARGETGRPRAGAVPGSTEGADHGG